MAKPAKKIDDTPDMKTLITRGAEIIDARTVWKHDRNDYLNASEAGQCIRQLWYAKHGAKAAPQQWGFARRGKAAERFVIDSLVAGNVPLRFAGADQQSIPDAELKISATPDGVIDFGNGEWILIEIKSFDPRSNTSKFPKPDNVLQLDIGIGLVAKHLAPKGVKVVRGLLIYINASDYDDIRQFEVTHDAGVLKRMAAKASKVLKTRSAEPLDREGKRDGGCRYCPFTEVCGVTADEASSRSGPARANRGSNFAAAATRFLEVKDEAAALEAEESDLKETIKQELASRKTTTATVGDIVVTLTSVAGRTTLDKAAVAKAGIDLSKFEKVGKPSERLEVKRAG